MITVDNLEAFAIFIHQPDQFDKQPVGEISEDSPKLDQDSIQMQILNQKKLKEDLQQIMKSCSRKTCLIHVDAKFNYQNGTFDNIDDGMWKREEGMSPLMPNLVDMVTFQVRYS